jgi:hypothetical protein
MTSPFSRYAMIRRPTMNSRTRSQGRSRLRRQVSHEQRCSNESNEVVANNKEEDQFAVSIIRKNSNLTLSTSGSRSRSDPIPIYPETFKKKVDLITSDFTVLIDPAVAHGMHSSLGSSSDHGDAAPAGTTDVVVDVSRCKAEAEHATVPDQETRQFFAESVTRQMHPGTFPTAGYSEFCIAAVDQTTGMRGHPVGGKGNHDCLGTTMAIDSLRDGTTYNRGIPMVGDPEWTPRSNLFRSLQTYDESKL